MTLKWIKTSVLASFSVALATFPNNIYGAIFDYKCDPDNAFCVFIKGDASLPKEVTITASLDFKINKETFSYFGEENVTAKSFFSLGFPVQLITDAQMTDLKIAVTKIDSQIMQNCVISGNTKSINPTLHTITIAAKKTPTGIEYQCLIDD